MVTLRSNRGFSLIEVIIALGVMMGAFTIISMAWSTSQIRLRKMKMNHQVAFLLDYKVADIEKEYRNDMSLLPEEDEGDFEVMGKEYKDFTWTLTSKKFELPDLTSFLAAQSDEPVDQMLGMMMKQLSEFFSLAVKEVTVTVIYTFNKKSVKYSATTFLIDFNQQLPIPNLSGLGGGDQGGN